MRNENNALKEKRSNEMGFLLIILALFFISWCQENWTVIFYLYVM